MKRFVIPEWAVVYAIEKITQDQKLVWDQNGHEMDVDDVEQLCELAGMKGELEEALRHPLPEEGE